MIELPINVSRIPLVSAFGFRHSFVLRHSCFVISLSFDHTAPDTLDLAMMCEHVNTSVAAAKKCTEQPTDDRNYDRAEKRAPETGNFKTLHYLANELQHQRINN